MEKEMTTRERIIFESLCLFSKKGYDGVSMREIAAAVGIKGASLYNHFKGKEDIFNGIFEEMMRQYGKLAAQMNISEAQADQTVQMFRAVDESGLCQMAESLFSFFAQNEFASMFRKLLMSEQHKSEMAAACLKEYYIEAPVAFQSQLFCGLQQAGEFLAYDADVMALHFYSPIYYVLSKFDLGYSYEECLEQLKSHVHYFCEIYRK